MQDETRKHLFDILQAAKDIREFTSISHGYDMVNPAIVWDVVQNHLPSLERGV